MCEKKLNDFNVTKFSGNVEWCLSIAVLAIDVNLWRGKEEFHHWNVFVMDGVVKRHAVTDCMPHDETRFEYEVFAVHIHTRVRQEELDHTDASLFNGEMEWRPASAIDSVYIESLIDKKLNEVTVAAGCCEMKESATELVAFVNVETFVLENPHEYFVVTVFSGNLQRFLEIGSHFIEFLDDLHVTSGDGKVYKWCFEFIEFVDVSIVVD